MESRVMPVDLFKCPNHGHMQESAAMGDEKTCPYWVADGKRCGQQLEGPVRFEVVAVLPSGGSS